jgi:hypothetical protein
MIQGYTPPAQLARVRNIALGVGVVFTLLMIVGALFDRAHFFHGYLVDTFSGSALRSAVSRC